MENVERHKQSRCWWSDRLANRHHISRFMWLRWLHIIRHLVYQRGRIGCLPGSWRSAYRSGAFSSWSWASSCKPAAFLGIWHERPQQIPWPPQSLERRFPPIADQRVEHMLDLWQWLPAGWSTHSRTASDATSNYMNMNMNIYFWSDQLNQGCIYAAEISYLSTLTIGSQCKI